MFGDHRSSMRTGTRIPTTVYICVALTLGLLFSGLWPFRFRTANNVRWIGGSHGLRFESFGIVSGKEPLFGPGGPVDLSLPFTLRMEVRPREEPSGSLPRILSAYDDNGRELFFLGQWRSELILRILKEERLFHLRYREAGAGGLQKDVTRSIVMRSDHHVLTLFVDGAPARTISGVDFSLLSDKRGPAWMILGNSPSGESPWIGDLLSLSFYPEALSPGDIESPGTTPVIHYGFSEGTGAVCRGGADSRYDLFIPSVFQAPMKGILVPPWREQKFDRSFWKDVFVNIIGFLPFGFAAYAWLRNDGGRKGASAIVISILLGAGISLFIELLQVHLPTRDSSLTDVLNNILGTYIGTRLFQAARDILYR
jgi:VanZ family protein